MFSAEELGRAVMAAAGFGSQQSRGPRRELARVPKTEARPPSKSHSKVTTIKGSDDSEPFSLWVAQIYFNDASTI